MKKRFYFIIIIALVFLIALFSCDTGVSDKTPTVFREFDGEQPTTQSQVVPYTLEEAVSKSTCAMEATFVEYTKDDMKGGFELEFQVNDVLKGGIDEDTIYVRVVSENWSDGKYTEYNYVEGHKYLLIASKDDSVYYEHPYYRVPMNLFLPLTDDIGAYMQYRELNSKSESIDHDKLSEIAPDGDITEYTKKLCAEAPTTDVKKELAYTDSTDMSEIIAESEFVLLVTPTASELVSDWRGTETFCCTVDRVIKDSSEDNPVPDQIYLPFFIDSVDTNVQYLVMVNRVNGADSGSMVFALAARTAVYPAVERLITAVEDAIVE